MLICNLADSMRQKKYFSPALFFGFDINLIVTAFAIWLPLPSHKVRHISNKWEEKADGAHY